MDKIPVNSLLSPLRATFPAPVLLISPLPITFLREEISPSLSFMFNEEVSEISIEFALRKLPSPVAGSYVELYVNAPSSITISPIKSLFVPVRISSLSPYLVSNPLPPKPLIVLETSVPPVTVNSNSAPSFMTVFPPV